MPQLRRLFDKNSDQKRNDFNNDFSVAAGENRNEQNEQK